MIVPKNQIISNQYTRGGEFVFASNGQDYNGYFCIILNSRYFTEKTYTSTSKELIKKLINKNQNYPTSNSNTSIRYFVKNLGLNPILIREISKQNYDVINNSSNPNIQVISLSNDYIFRNSPFLTQAEITMPGIKAFLGF